MQHLLPNTTLQGGKYRIERVLGQGGFGITYLAEQVSLGRKVAIKEFFMKDFCLREDVTNLVSIPSTGSSRQVEMYRKKFVKEAHNLARLNHPNIISVIEVFEENSTVYYVMPYLSVGSLYDYVKNHGALSEDEAMKYIRQIAKALKYMHEDMHICHYDVKPSNILLDGKGNAILIDFGISKNYDDSGHETSTTPVGRSDGYAPIEQYITMGVSDFSPASDVYALGATLYFLLHGKSPVSAPKRAGGTALLMKKSLSPTIKSIINASMKISKTERAKNMDVFLGNIVYSSPKMYTSSQDEDEMTVIQSSNKTDRSNTTYTQSNVSASAGNPTTTQGNNSIIGWIVGIAVVVIVGFFIFNNQGNGETASYPNSNNDNVESISPTTAQPQEETKDIYKERVEQFAKKKSGVIASFPDDKRYSVYYSKKDEYGRRFLYRYDAIADKSEKMDLPIEATAGEYTGLWVTKNRYIFVAAEYRYTDFIRIDTQTSQVKYITDCASVKRTSSGFTVVQSECINEYAATCEADKEYAYTDYYYNEEGINVGHGQQYR